MKKQILPTLLLVFFIQFNLVAQSDYSDYSSENKVNIFYEDFSDNSFGWPTGGYSWQGEIEMFSPDIKYILKKGYYELRSNYNTNIDVIFYPDRKGIWNKEDNKNFEIEYNFLKVKNSSIYSPFIEFSWGASRKYIKDRFAFKIYDDKYYFYKVFDDIQHEKATGKIEINKQESYKFTIRKIYNNYYFFLNETLLSVCPYEPYFGKGFKIEAMRESTYRIEDIRFSFLEKEGENFPPKITIASSILTTGTDGKTVSGILVTGKVEDADGISKVLVDGITANLDNENKFSINIPYTTGKLDFEVVATDKKSKTAKQTIKLQNGLDNENLLIDGKKITMDDLNKVFNFEEESKKKIEDKTAPTITIIAPQVNRGFSIVQNTTTYKVVGNVMDQSKIQKVLLNNEEVTLDANGTFTKSVNLKVGENSFTVEATDEFKNAAKKTFTIKQEVEKKESVVADNNTKPDADILKTGKYYALIIGNNDYTDDAIATLDEPIKDATKLYEVLTAKYSFQPENVTLLKNADYVEMIDAFEALSNTLTKEDNLLVFYAGHGWWDETKNLGYWLPTNAKRSSPAFWIRNSTISDYMATIKTKHTLLIADACFSGSIFKTRAAFDDASLAIKKLNDLTSKTAMTSGNLKEVPDQSVFLKYLVKRLSENTEKYLPADKLFSSFRIAVMNNSPNAPQFGTIQNAGDEGGEFIFVKKD